MLNSEQEVAVKSINGPVLLLAVPGSGKTTTLITRLGYMTICKGITPSSILALTFTDKAADEMKNRYIEKFHPSDSSSIHFSTINSFCYGISNKVYGYKKVTDESTKLSFLRSILSKIVNNDPTDSELLSLSNDISRVKNSINPIRAMNTLSTNNPYLKRVFNEYNSLLKRKHQIDFDDQLRNAYNVSIEKPNVFEKYQSQFKYICIDEAQDNTELQNEFIKRLAKKHNNIFVVGDEDQSIYRFRGAAPDYLLHFNDTFSNAHTLKLETNYRSIPEIVKASKKFIDRNKHHIKKEMCSVRANNGGIYPVVVPSTSNQCNIIMNILRLLNGTTAILYRNNYSGLPIMYYFTKAKINYTINNSANRLFDSTCMNMLLNLLNYSTDLNNKQLFKDIVTEFGLIKNDIIINTVNSSDNSFLLETFIEQIRQYTGYNKKNEEAHRKNTMHIGIEIINCIHTLSSGVIPDFIAEFNAFCNKHPKTMKKFIFSDNYIKALDIEEHNISVLYKHLKSIKNNLSNNKNAISNVYLSTIHSAKGMEFDNVIIVDCVDGTFPLDNEATDYEEERRLFYVAITRAKDNIYLIKRTSEATSFINEITTN